MRIDTDEEFVYFLTNVVMDIVRERLNIDMDSDEDDELYGEIHQAIKEAIEETKKV